MGEWSDKILQRSFYESFYQKHCFLFIFLLQKDRLSDVDKSTHMQAEDEEDTHPPDRAVTTTKFLLGDRERAR